jgi:hypothetical protein
MAAYRLQHNELAHKLGIFFAAAASPIERHV